MSDLIRNLWDLFLQKKKTLDMLIISNIKLCKKLLFINQAAEIAHLMEKDDISSIVHLQSVLIDHGYFMSRVLEFIDCEELVNIQFEDLPLVSNDEIIHKEEIRELTDFIRKIRPYYSEEISIIYLILNLKKKRMKTEVKDVNQIIISPPKREKNIQKSISMNLSNENSIWNAIYSQEDLIKEDFLFTLGDSSGIGKITKAQLDENWDIFCELWEKTFLDNMKFTKSQFFNTLDYLIKFKNNLPFSRNNLKSKELEEIPKLVLSNIFSISKQVLPNIKKMPVLENINSIRDEYFNHIKKLSIGWKYISNKKDVYLYTPTKNSITFFINRVFEVLFEEINIAGDFYEKELGKRISSLNNGLIKLKENRNYILGYEPEYVDKPEKLSKIYDVQILERNLPINIPEMDALNIAKKGEIDLLIYSNNNLFILEAKSFFGKRIKKAFQKASEQCTKYRAWIDTDEFKEIVENKHGIERYRNIYIFIITNRQEGRLFVKCTKSNLYFPVISFSMLPLLLLGFYIIELSTKQLIPKHLIDILIDIVKKDFSGYSILDDPEQFEGYRSIWRKYMYIILHSSTLPENFDFSKLSPHPFSAGYQAIDHMIGDPTKWELEDFVNVGNAEDYEVLLVTQLSNIYFKYICHNCKIIWIYYYPGTNIEEKPIFEELSNYLCIKCHKKMKKKSINDINLKSKAGILIMMRKVEISNRKIGKID